MTRFPIIESCALQAGRLLAMAVAGVALAGCASKLSVFDATHATIDGVPFRATELYLRFGKHDKHSTKGDECTPADYVQTASLATGAQYYANVKPADFAKTGFTMKLSDSGALTEIDLNTEPSAAESVTAAGSLLTAALPLLGAAAAAAPAASLNPKANPFPACDTGDDPAAIRFVRFDQRTK